MRKPAAVLGIALVVAIITLTWAFAYATYARSQRCVQLAMEAGTAVTVPLPESPSDPGRRFQQSVALEKREQVMKDAQHAYNIECA